VLRTVWRIKDSSTPQGNAENARPDFHELNVCAEVVIWCDSAEEPHQKLTLEKRVRAAIEDPSSVTRFGGWSLGESTHLINDSWPLGEAAIPPDCRVFIVDNSGDTTLPVWVDHVGTAGTRHCVGRIVTLQQAPLVADLPRISPT
jgi:CRISPR-associated protein Cas5t